MSKEGEARAILQQPDDANEQFDNSDFRCSSHDINSPTERSNSNAIRETHLDPGPAPNGGLRAWTQVFMGHLILINSWGYLTSFGLFESYYTSQLGFSASAISWIGSFQIFLVYLVGTFSGRALDAGHYHTVIGIGCLLQLVGVFMTSLSTQYWQLFLAQGVCKGLGDGLVFCPTVALVATYFTTKRAVAMACTASGGAVGGIIFPLIAEQLLPKLGFGWTVRIMGFVILFNTIVIMTIARVRLPPRKRGPLVEWAAFKDLPYTLFCGGMFFCLWAVYFAYFYVSTFGKTVIHLSSSTSLIVLLVTNAIGLPARVIAGLVADRFGAINTLIPFSFLSGVLLYAWAGVNTTAELFVFSVIYGFFAAGVQSLFPAACASLTPDLSKIGVRTGMCFSVVSIACLTGPPIAGALIGTDTGFLGAQMFGGSALVSGSCILLSALLYRERLRASKT